jgi:hypothetical protein
MEGPVITGNYFHLIYGNLAGPSNGYGIWVSSNITYRPRRGVIEGNKFSSNSTTSSYACGTLAAANGADSWVLVGNSVYNTTACSNGDWATGAQEVMASNQAP